MLCRARCQAGPAGLTGTVWMRPTHALLPGECYEHVQSKQCVVLSWPCASITLSSGKHSHRQNTLTAGRTCRSTNNQQDFANCWDDCLAPSPHAQQTGCCPHHKQPQQTFLVLCQTLGNADSASVLRSVFSSFPSLKVAFLILKVIFTFDLPVLGAFTEEYAQYYLLLITI